MGSNDTYAPDSEEVTKREDKVSAMLVNVYGLKLPNEMFSQAARRSDELARILHEYAEAIQQSKR